MKHTKHLLLSIITINLLLQPSLLASQNNHTTQSKDWIVLPYAFSSASTGLAGGIGIIKQGILQPQTTMVTSVFGGMDQDVISNGIPRTENFSGGFFSFSDYKLPFTQRTLFSLIGIKSFFPKQKYYFKGSNNSHPDTALSTAGQSNFIMGTFKYVVPIGEGLENPDGLYRLQDGFAQGREGYGNGTPFVTGSTTIGMKMFYQEESFENWSNFALWKNKTSDSTPVWNSNGLRLFLSHDNTDYNLNPSRGYHFDLQYSKDFGKGDSLQSWDFLELKYNKYYSLDTFSFTKQNVLALSLWTGYSFSWDTRNEIAPGIAKNRAPLGEGARLGGFSRMRGYENSRFSDKAVVYGTAEYRAVLDYNPLKKNSVVPVAVDWFQVVAFVEAGRVNDKYNFDLLTDLKYDVGLSLRAMVAQLPIRFDIAYGDEGPNMWVMIQQPFDF